MKMLVKKLTLVASLCLGLLLAAAPARAQLGLAVGYDLDMMSEPSFSSSAANSFDGSGAFGAGLFYGLDFGPVTLRPGLFVNQSSYDWTLDGVAFSPLETVVRRVQVPFDVLFRFSAGPMSPYVLAGPAINYLHTDQPDLRQVLDRERGSTNYGSVNLGAGLEIRSPRLGLRLLPEIRYSHALSGFLQEEYIVRTVNFAADGSPKMSALTFRLGVSFLSVQ